MIKLIEGRVTKAVGGVFAVYADKKYICFAPKKLRFNENEVLVGDKVLFSVLKDGKGTISEVLPRKNRLLRPEVANVEYIFILIAQIPSPDFVLVDKLLVSAHKRNITPVLVVNKCDISDQKFLKSVVEEYKNECSVEIISATNDIGIEKLKSYLNGNIVCLAGQSAVGKTSLLNCICPELNKKTGGLSQKTMRGTHTTRHSQIFKAGGGFLVDTTGFSLLELDGILDWELGLYYGDMAEISQSCRFNMCTHTAEPDCAVKKAVGEGQYPSGRFERYLEIHKQLLESKKTNR